MLSYLGHFVYWVGKDKGERTKVKGGRIKDSGWKAWRLGGGMLES